MGTPTPYNEQYNPQADPAPDAGTDSSSDAEQTASPEVRKALIGELVRFKPLPSVGGAVRSAVVMDVHEKAGTVDLKVFNGYCQSTTDVREVESSDSETPGKFTFVSQQQAQTAKTP